MRKRILSPSILAADFGHLAREMAMLDRSEAQWVHVDVMDGVFVPNISFGFPVLAAVRALTAKPLDVHLMIVDPERYVARFAAAGADVITVHHEAVADMAACLALIHAAGAKAGVSIRPATDVEVLAPYLDALDLVLVMSVEPGFGGQGFRAESLDKVRALRAMIDARGLSTLIEIDGGISSDNAAVIFAAGADVLVVGSAVFGAEDPEEEICKLLEVI